MGTIADTRSASHSDTQWRKLFNDGQFLQTRELPLGTLMKIHEAAKSKIIFLTEPEDRHLGRLFSEEHDRYFERKKCHELKKVAVFFFCLLLIAIISILLIKFLL